MRPFLGPPFPGMRPSALRRSRESRRFVSGLGIPGRPRRPPAYTNNVVSQSADAHFHLYAALVGALDRLLEPFCGPSCSALPFARAHPWQIELVQITACLSELLGLPNFGRGRSVPTRHFVEPAELPVVSTDR